MESAPPVRQSTTSDIRRFLQDTDLFSCCEAAGAAIKEREKKKKIRSPTERVPSPLCLAVSASRPSGEVPCVRPCRALPCHAVCPLAPVAFASSPPATAGGLP